LRLAVLNKAKQYQNLITIGRSHGMYAEPMSFGQKLLLFYSELSRREQDLKNFYHNEITGQISGSVGNYAIANPEIERLVMKELGLKVEPLSTQVIPRDRLAKLVQIFSLYAANLERFCIEIRHLHRSDVNELQEGFRKGQ